MNSLYYLYKNRINPTNRCREKYVQRYETQRDVTDGKKLFQLSILKCFCANRLRSARLETKRKTGRLGTSFLQLFRFFLLDALETDLFGHSGTALLCDVIVDFKAAHLIYLPNFWRNKKCRRSKIWTLKR